MEMGTATQRELEEQVLAPVAPPSGMKRTGYDALHRSAALLDLSNRGKIVVRGPDRVGFVDSLVSNNVRGLGSGDSCYAFFLNEDGYVIGDAHVVCLREEILIDTEPELRISLLRHMERNMAGDVRLLDVTDRVSTLSVEGPHAPEVVARGGFPIPGGQYEFLEIPFGWIGRLNTTGQAGFFFLVSSVRKFELISQMEAAGAIQASDEEMRVVRIERGKPRYGEEITPEYLAEETGLCHALDFEKGLYLGRQVIHDIHSHGCLKKVLVSVDTDAVKVAHPHTNLFFRGKERGHLISSVYSPTYQKIIGLAYVQPEFAFTGIEFLAGKGMHVRVRGRIDTGIRSCD
jgi:glycine cleavage system aminomethyltransferase T